MPPRRSCARRSNTASPTPGARTQADETRRLALLESYFRTFAQAGAAAQQRHLDDLTGPEHRALSRPRPPLPEEDAEGRAEWRSSGTWRFRRSRTALPEVPRYVAGPLTRTKPARVMHSS